MKRVIIRPRDRNPNAAAIATAVVDAAVEAHANAGAKIVRANREGRHVARMPPAVVRDLARSRPDLTVEDDQPLELFRMPGLPPMMPATAAQTTAVRVVDIAGAPISDCSVYAVGGSVGFRGISDRHGDAVLTLDPALIERIVVSPRADYWSAVLPLPDTSKERIEAVLSPLDAVAASDWVHRLIGLQQVKGAVTGRGVSVAIVDSGIAQVPGLHVVGGLNTLDDDDPEAWNIDEKGHGTHCAGIVAAQPDASVKLRGVAPDASLYAVKVFPGGFVSDLIEALDWCAERRIDLVNMSLGCRNRSDALAFAIDRACMAGVTVVAATGNDSTHVAFPAAHSRVLGVSAVGRFGSFPTTSAHVLKIGSRRDWWGGLFDASFNNYGPEVMLCAPGIAVPSTVPQGYAAWDGTSMACPIVCGLMALVLEAFPSLRTGTVTQVDALRWIAQSSAADTGMPSIIQGFGLATAPRMFAAAQRLLRS